MAKTSPKRKVTLVQMVGLKRRSDIHWERKAWHMLGVALMSVIYLSTPTHISFLLMAIAWVLFVPFDFFRHRSVWLNDLAMKVFSPIMREHEAKKMAGTSYLFSGVLIILALFPREVVIPTLWFLAFADPFASVIGIKYGRHKIFGHKSIEGFLAAFAVCALVSILYFFRESVLPEHRFLAAILAGFLGALAELVPIADLDDNLTLPVVSAFGLWGIYLLFGHSMTLGANF